jgi:hypothetical protein
MTFGMREHCTSKLKFITLAANYITPLCMGFLQYTIVTTFIKQLLTYLEV